MILTIIPRGISRPDQYDAYKLVNPFNGKPDQCTYGGFTWKVTQADGSGNNIWEPGVYGWTKV